MTGSLTVAVRNPLGDSAGAELGRVVRTDRDYLVRWASGYTADWSVKVVCYGEQTVGLQFAKDAAQFLLQPVYGVEESPAIQLEFLAA